MVLVLVLEGGEVMVNKGGKSGTELWQWWWWFVHSGDDGGWLWIPRWYG
jgi:hypothetical protein